MKKAYNKCYYCIMSVLNIKNENEVLTIKCMGRIDSGNAGAVRDEIKQALDAGGFEKIVVDAENLEYISSAGLRSLLFLKKAFSEMKIINVSSEVYGIFEMTGFSEIMTIEKAFRRLDVSGCTVIGEGAKGIVYRYDDDTIVKVFKDPDSLDIIKRERELARKAFVLGIPTAISYDIVRVGDYYGSVFELLDASSLSECVAENPDKFDDYMNIYVGLLRQIHDTSVQKNEMPDIKILIGKWVDASEPYLDPEDFLKLTRLVDSCPDSLTLLHGDYHTNNIMMQNGEALLIDMDTLCHGHPVFELANIFCTWVAFGEVDREKEEAFTGLPHETSQKIWYRFIRAYLDTDDESIVAEVEDKVKLMAYVRVLRHTVRRGIKNETDEKAVAMCSERIPALLDRVDTLDF